MLNDEQPPEITLRLWSAADLPLLQRLMGDPAMTEHLGGPETAEQIRSRHERYTRLPQVGENRMFVILAGGVVAGNIGYWMSEWRDEPVWETGWAVLPEFQGQGIATRALALLLEKLRAAGGPRLLCAFPAVDNGASNAVCRKAGFVLAATEPGEYPPGQYMQVNVWRLDLAAGSKSGPD